MLHIICTALDDEYDVNNLALASPLTFMDVVMARPEEPLTFTDRLVKGLGWLSHHRLDLVQQYLAGPLASGGKIKLTCSASLVSLVHPAILAQVSEFDCDLMPVMPADVPSLCLMTGLTSMRLVITHLSTGEFDALARAMPHIKTCELREKDPYNWHYTDDDESQDVCLHHLNEPLSARKLGELRSKAPPFTPKMFHHMKHLETLVLDTFRFDNNFFSHLPAGLKQLHLPGVREGQLTPRGIKK